MKTVEITRYDAFTNTPGKGNPAGIIFNGDQYSADEMQKIAYLVGYNECCFICSSSKADLRLRYFTPGHETPLCGHATIASIVALMERNKIENDTVLDIETLAGVITVQYHCLKREVTMEQTDAQLIPFEGDKSKLLQSIGLDITDYEDQYPIVYGSTGSWTVIVPIRTLESFTRMKPDNKQFIDILYQNNRASVHPITLQCYDDKHTLHGRHFSSHFSGTVEDSVTGTASGVMSAYYLQYMMAGTATDFLIEQGNEIGKEGTVHVEARCIDDKIKVKISGQAVSNGIFLLDLE